MVFRTADVFLRGLKGWTQYRDARGGQQNPDQMWGAINANVGALYAFFDAIIMEDCLPMYDYDSTFPPDIDIGATSTHWLFSTCNDVEEVLVEVSVRDTAYRSVKKAAIAQMDELPDIASSTADDILNELSAFDYEWRPDLWQGVSPESVEERERVLDAFRYGGLLFSGYSQLTGADHVLQPKRSRLYLAASLGTKRAERVNDEKAMFAELTKVARKAPKDVLRTTDLPERPAFLPYLMDVDNPSPRKLLKRAIQLRRSGIVNEYRKWWREVIDDLEKGRGQPKKDEIDRIAAQLSREFDPNSENKINVQVSAS